MNPSLAQKLPVLSRFDDHFEWKQEHTIALTNAELYIVIQYN
jgi:hypothetical protein